MDWDHEKAVPFAGAPPYFRRVWDPEPPPEKVLLHGMMFAVVDIPVPDGGLVIIGYATRGVPEDRRLEDDAWAQRRVFPAVNYSEMCPEGEFGWIPESEVTEISREEFVAELAAIQAPSVQPAGEDDRAESA